MFTENIFSYRLKVVWLKQGHISTPIMSLYKIVTILNKPYEGIQRKPEGSPDALTQPETGNGVLLRRKRDLGGLPIYEEI